MSKDLVTCSLNNFQNIYPLLTFTGKTKYNREPHSRVFCCLDCSPRLERSKGHDCRCTLLDFGWTLNQAFPCLITELSLLGPWQEIEGTGCPRRSKRMLVSTLHSGQPQAYVLSRPELWLSLLISLSKWGSHSLSCGLSRGCLHLLLSDHHGQQFQLRLEKLLPKKCYSKELSPKNQPNSTQTRK